MKLMLSDNNTYEMINGNPLNLLQKRVFNKLGLNGYLGEKF